MVPTFATNWLLPRLGGFRRAHPHIIVNLTARTRPFLFDDTALDAAIYAGEASWPGTQGHFLMRENLIAVASPALIAPRKVLKASQLARLPLLQQTTRPHAWRHWFQSQGLEVENDLAGPRLELFSMLAKAAIHGMGVSLIPKFLVEKELEAGLLVQVVKHDYLSDRPTTSSTRSARAATGRRSPLFATGSNSKRGSTASPWDWAEVPPSSWPRHARWRCFFATRNPKELPAIAAGVDLGRTASGRFVLAYAVRSRGAPRRPDQLRGSIAQRRLTTRIGNTRRNSIEKGIAMADVLAPLAGKILAVLVEAGAKVEEDDELLVIEALKMENHRVCAQWRHGEGNQGEERRQVEDEALLLVLE